MSKAKKVVLGAAAGAAMGFVAGILLAPKSGKETREDLKKGAKKAVKEADKHLKKVHSELSHMADKLEDQLGSMSQTAKTEANAALTKAKKTRDQVATVLAAARSGNSSDEDLDIAVKNAQNALESLKKFLKK